MYLPLNLADFGYHFLSIAAGSVAPSILYTRVCLCVCAKTVDNRLRYNCFVTLIDGYSAFGTHKKLNTQMDEEKWRWKMSIEMCFSF